MTAPERIWLAHADTAREYDVPIATPIKPKDYPFPVACYILATPSALANSPEVQALIAAETKAMQERVERLEAIGRRILEGDERGQGIQWSEAMSELEAILKETTHD